MSVGFSVNSEDLWALLSFQTSWSWRSGWGPQPHPQSGAGSEGFPHSWSRRSARSKHWRHHCWHRHQSTSHRAHIFFSLAFSAKGETRTYQVINGHIDAKRKTFYLQSLQGRLVLRLQWLKCFKDGTMHCLLTSHSRARQTPLISVRLSDYREEGLPSPARKQCIYAQ